MIHCVTPSLLASIQLETLETPRRADYRSPSLRRRDKGREEITPEEMERHLAAIEATGLDEYDREEMAEIRAQIAAFQ